MNPTGTGDYKSNSCPAGYTCPIGSSQPTPCRPGTFGNRSGAEDASDCHPCPAGTFNHLQARTACFPCGSSSTSQAGWIRPVRSGQTSSFVVRKTSLTWKSTSGHVSLRLSFLHLLGQKPCIPALGRLVFMQDRLYLL